MILPTLAGQDFQLPLGVELPGETRVFLPAQLFRLQAGELTKLSLFAESLSQPGEVVDLWLRAEDQYGNLVASADLSLDLRVNGTFRQRIDVLLMEKNLA